jgi:hypothetical protein
LVSQHRDLMHQVRVLRPARGNRVGDIPGVLGDQPGNNLLKPAPQLAHHFALAAPAGTAHEAVRYASRAAERARDQLAYKESVRLFTMALRSHEYQTDADAETRCELLLALGDAQTRAGDAVAAQQSFVRAADIARQAGWADRLARAALGYGGRFVWEPDRERTQPDCSRRRWVSSQRTVRCGRACLLDSPALSAGTGVVRLRPGANSR